MLAKDSLDYSEMSKSRAVSMTYPLSPLRPLRNFLAVSKYLGGFPLRVGDEDVSEFEYSRAAYCALAYVIFTTICILPLELLTLRLLGVSFAQLWKSIRGLGVSTTDLVALSIMLGSNIVTIFLFLFLYKGADVAMTRLFTHLKRTPWILVSESK